MEPQEFRDILADLDMTIIASSRLFRVNERTSRRWAVGDLDIPWPVEMVLRIMQHERISARRVTRIMGVDDANAKRRRRVG